MRPASELERAIESKEISFVMRKIRFASLVTDAIFGTKMGPD